jgi:hypothetical protein
MLTRAEIVSVSPMPLASRTGWIIRTIAERDDQAETSLHVIPAHERVKDSWFRRWLGGLARLV